MNARSTVHEAVESLKSRRFGSAPPACVAADPEDPDGELIELVRVAAALILHGLADLPAAGGPLTERVAAYERALIKQALAATRGRRSEAARRLQVIERILRYRVERYGIDHTRFRR